MSVSSMTGGLSARGGTEDKSFVRNDTNNTLTNMSS